MEKLKLETIQKREDVINTSNKENEKIWDENIKISPHEYHLIGRRRLESIESDNVFQRIKDNLLEFAKTVKFLIKGEQLPLYNIEKNSEFFDFLVESSRDFKTLLLELQPFKQKPSLGGYCHEASKALTYWLNYQIKKKFPNEVVEAVVIAGDFLPYRNGHFWVQIGHTIIDISVHQFKYSQKSKISDEINKKTTEEGIFISNDESNVLYRNYIPRTIYDVMDGKEWKDFILNDPAKK